MSRESHAEWVAIPELRRQLFLQIEELATALSHALSPAAQATPGLVSPLTSPVQAARRMWGAGRRALSSLSLSPEERATYVAQQQCKEAEAEARAEYEQAQLQEARKGLERSRQKKLAVVIASIASYLTSGFVVRDIKGLGLFQEVVYGSCADIARLDDNAWQEECRAIWRYIMRFNFPPEMRKRLTDTIPKQRPPRRERQSASVIEKSSMASTLATAEVAATAAPAGAGNRELSPRPSIDTDLFVSPATSSPEPIPANSEILTVWRNHRAAVVTLYFRLKDEPSWFFGARKGAKRDFLAELDKRLAATNKPQVSQTELEAIQRNVFALIEDTRVNKREQYNLIMAGFWSHRVADMVQATENLAITLSSPRSS